MGQASGNHKGETNSMSQVDGVSYTAPACWPCGCVRGGLRKGSMAPASTFVWEKAAPSSHSNAGQFSFSLYVCDDFQSATPRRSSEGVSSSKSVHRPFKRTFLGSRNICLLQPQYQLVFIARGYIDISSWHWDLGLGGQLCGWGPLLLRYPS